MNNEHCSKQYDSNPNHNVICKFENKRNKTIISRNIIISGFKNLSKYFPKKKSPYIAATVVFGENVQRWARVPELPSHPTFLNFAFAFLLTVLFAFPRSCFPFLNRNK